MKQPIIFSEIKQQIHDALMERAKDASIGITEDLGLVDGITSMPIFPNMGSSENLFYIPHVILIGQKSGRMYLFALKALLPDLDV